MKDRSGNPLLSLMEVEFWGYEGYIRSCLQAQMRMWARRFGQEQGAWINDTVCALVPAHNGEATAAATGLKYTGLEALLEGKARHLPIASHAGGRWMKQLSCHCQ